MTKHLIRLGVGLAVMAVIVSLAAVLTYVPYADYIIMGLLTYYCGTVVYQVYQDRKNEKDWLQK